MGQEFSCVEAIEQYGMFGSQWCDSPWSLVNDTVQAMGRLKPDADFIIWTGDSTPHTSDKNVNLEILDALIGNCTNLIKDVFPNTPVYPTLGNHDNYPHNQYPPNGNLLYNKTFEKWREWIGDETAESFLKGGYYSLKTKTGMRVIGLNTNLYYTTNKQVGNPPYPDPADQFVWLEQTLQSARTNKEKVLVTAHIPPGVTPTNGITWFYNQYNKRMNSIIMNFADVIVGLHCAHEHTNNFRVHHTDSGKGAVLQLCAPSVTPWRYKVPIGTGPAHNPSVRLLKYDRTSGALLDYTQYYMDFHQANRNNVSEWKIEYNATVAFNIPDLFPSSVAELIKRMKRRESTEFKYFHRFWTTSIGETFQEDCDIACHIRFYCNFKHVDHADFHRCVKEFSVSSAYTCAQQTGLHAVYFILLCLYLIKIFVI